MGKFWEEAGKILPPAVQTAGNIISSLFNRNQERKEYERMLEYNSPKAQMQRYREAGLSPYLIYGQGSSGNVSSPAPAKVLPESSGQGFDRYVSMANFDADIKNKRLQNAILANEVSRSHWRTITEGLNATRKELDMLSDYPQRVTWQDYSKTRYGYKSAPSHGDVDQGFRRKVNELKLALSDASVQKIQEAIRGMKSDNVVRDVKAGYAKDYGMVGGDWTQGLGLIKSLPSFFKSRAKSSVSIPQSTDRVRKVRYNSSTWWNDWKKWQPEHFPQSPYDKY